MAYRSGLVALAGRPNVGKSTLANALAGSQVAAVSPRPQTTRRRITAVVHGEDWQAVLLDLPGFQRPADGLTARMQATVNKSLADCDAALYVLNAAEPVGGGDRLHRRAPEGLAPAGHHGASTRSTASTPDAARAAIARAAAAGRLRLAAPGQRQARATASTSCAPTCRRCSSEGPRYFPEGMATDQTEEELAAELIREAALLRLREEIPHALAVDVREIEPARHGIVVRAVLLVETESQKSHRRRPGRAMVRDIGSSARSALGRLWGTEVHLDLTVRVRKRWRDDESMLTRLGL